MNPPLNTTSQLTAFVSSAQQARWQWGANSQRTKIKAALLALLMGLSLMSAQAGVVLSTNAIDWLSDPAFFTLDTTYDLVLGLSATPGGGALNSGVGFGSLARLTDGDTGPTANPTITPGYYYQVSEGNILTYDIGLGSTVTNIHTYSGWGDGGRDRQDYAVSVSTDNVTYTNLAAVAGVNGPGTSGGTSVEVVISDDVEPFLVSGIRYVRFTFANVENGFVGYTEIIINGANGGTLAAPGIVTDLPTALAVGRSQQLTLAVTGTGNPPPRYQWFKDGNSITGAIGSSLTISGFKVSDNGTYFVTLTNSQGYTNSVSCVVTMTNPPPSLVPLFIDIASQNASFDPIDTTNDLLLGLIPAGYTNGQPMGAQYNLHGVVDDLTDGQTRNDDIDHEAIFPSGTVLTYLLTDRSDITKVATYSSWPDGGRVNQEYTLSVSTNGGSSFTTITNVAAVPSVGGSPLQLQVMISPNGPYIATNVTHVRFAFPSVQNNGVGYTELVVQGTPSPAGLLAAPGFATNLPLALGAGRQLP